MDIRLTKKTQSKLIFSISTVLNMSLLLLMLGFAFTLIINAKKVSDNARKNIGFTLFLDNNAKAPEITELQNYLKKADYTDSLKFVGKDKAAAEMKTELGEDFIQFLGENPLPNSFEVRIKHIYSSADSIAEIKTTLEKFSIIKDFFWEQSLIKAYDFNIKKLSLIAVSLLFILLFISAVFINHAIKISVIENGLLNPSVYSDNYNIPAVQKKMKTAGLLSGTLSASIASLILVISLLILQPDGNGFLSLDGIWLILIIIFIFAVAMSGISTYFATTKYLPAQFHQKTEK